MSPTVVATILLGSLLVASALVASANQVQPENSQHIPSDAAAAAHHHHQQQQQHSSSPNVVGVVQPVPPQAPVVGMPEQQQQQVGPQPIVHMAEQQHQPPAASYYSPAAGMIQVVGEQQQQPIVGGSSVGQNKPGQVVRNLVAPAEQYGQPESASVPANYKPWGSWGLYIGGNPADGYYTDYYKALGNSVNKQQQQQQQVAGGAPVNQVSAFSPVLKQAGSSPYVGADYYPFAYSPNELNSGYQQPMAVVHHQPQSPSGSVMSAGSPSSSSASSSMSSPIAPQVYSAGGVVGQPEAPMYAYNYADNYANTKRFGSAPFAAPSGQQAKSYASPKMMATSGAHFAYPNMAPAAPAAAAKHPQQQQQQQQQQQLYAYPVPVGSQIVGSQQGVEGAFMPYGVHAFTRYAVKPTMMNSAESGYYYSAPSAAYKQQQMAAGNQQQQVYSPPMGYYGPQPSGQMAQLHYSSSIDGVFGNQQQQQQQPMVNGQQVGVIDSPVSSYAPHIVHQPAIQFEASASETSATSAAASATSDKVPQKNKNNQQDKQQ